jgi:hypothetical protein
VIYLLPLLALDAPDFPSVEPIEGECPYAVELDPAIQGCHGLILPTSDAAELLEWKVYGEALATLYEVDTGVLEIKIGALQEPPPFWSRPGVQRWTGRGEGLVLGAAVGALVAVYALK